MKVLDFEKYYPDLSLILSDIGNIDSANNIAQYFDFDIKRRDDLEKWKSYFTVLRDQIDEILSYDDFPQDVINNISKELFEEVSEKLDEEINQINTQIPSNKINFYKKKPVRCWRLDLGNRGIIYISLPHPNYGYDLISCKKCGEIYCYSREKQTYEEQISERVEKIKCFKCDLNLGDSYFLYPNKFINSYGEIDSFDVDSVYSISEKDTFLRKFYSIDD